MVRSRHLGWFVTALTGIGVVSAAAIPACLTRSAPSDSDGVEATRSALTPAVNWLQYGGDSVHSSNNTTENGIGLSNVSTLSLLFSAAGATQPLVANGKVYVVNFAQDQILSYDARTGAAGPTSPALAGKFSGR